MPTRQPWTLPVTLGDFGMELGVRCWFSSGHLIASVALSRKGELLKTRNIVAVFICLMFVVAPIFFYFDKFGIGYWSSNSDWGSFGSFFGGVLGPILSFISIIILWVSLIESNRANKEQLNQLQEHNLEASFIQGITILQQHALVEIESHPNPGSSIVERMPTRDAVKAFHFAIDKGIVTENQVRNRLWDNAESYFKTIFYLIEVLEDADRKGFDSLRLKRLLESQLTGYDITWSKRVSDTWLTAKQDEIVRKWLN